MRWETGPDGPETKIGYGILVLDRENPERILYRSSEPIEGKIKTQSGWTGGRDNGQAWVFLERAEEAVPEKVKFEIGRIYEIAPMPSDMTKWLKHKSGRLQEG